MKLHELTRNPFKFILESYKFAVMQTIVQSMISSAWKKSYCQWQSYSSSKVLLPCKFSATYKIEHQYYTGVSSLTCQLHTHYVLDTNLTAIYLHEGDIKLLFIPEAPSFPFSTCFRTVHTTLSLNMLIMTSNFPSSIQQNAGRN